MKNKGKVIKNLISMVLLILVFIGVAKFYNQYNYNDFVKSVTQVGKTDFTRDSSVKYSKTDSYKLENKEYHDAMFSKKVSVIPNTPYKVTCMVKAENIENKENTKSGGAHISINGTTERSNFVQGTKDWQKLTFYFNSKNRSEVDIGFRLGGYAEESKGTAWFSDFTMEVGTANQDKTWKMACFIFPNIDVNVEVEGKMKHVKLEMTKDDIATVKTNLIRFQTSIAELSKNKMAVTYETYTISEPIKTLSYDEENGYYVSAEDVYEYIDSYVQKNQYDHIYIAFRMADKQKGNDILVNDWIGLGGMDYYGIGFSNIRMPDDENNYAYQYHYLINTFPEEVFIHEFLHTLERNSSEYGYEVPALHDYKKYGYTEERLEGQKKWYEDYMNKSISYNGEKIGLPKEIYTFKPVQEKNFTYSTKIDTFHEPENIIEVIRSLREQNRKAI
ncbi:MAG: hypothetical protein HFJ28_06600 [Clostridia bacterium]|nr:hypothetical protein [Clostridia bacterium]